MTTKSYSIRARQTFSAVSQHQSLTRAAHDLDVTQSAVTHPLSKLPSEVGETLIVKSERELQLTETGQRLADALRSAFGQIEESVAPQAIAEGAALIAWFEEQLHPVEDDIREATA